MHLKNWTVITALKLYYFEWFREHFKTSLFKDVENAVSNKRLGVSLSLDYFW